MSRTESLFSHFPSVEAPIWKQRVIDELRGADYSKIVWKSPDGFAMEPWYNRQTALPAVEVPFRRTTNRWSICRRIHLSRLAADPLLLEEAVAAGADAIEFVFDGTDTPADTATLVATLREIDLARIAVYCSGAIEKPSALLWQLMQLPGFASNTGALLCPPTGTLDELKTLVPAEPGISPYRTIAIDTLRFHEEGATIVQELAFTLAAISDCLATLTGAGIDATAAAGQIETVLACGTSHFPELAKLRALRAMWPHLLEAYGVTPENRPEPRLFVRASLRSFSVLDPYTNLLRLSTEALSAILGGCDTLQLSPFDPAGSVPEDIAERITGNIQLLFMEESSLDHVIDPGAGSWYIETMTATLCREAWKLFQQIEAEGGLRLAEANGTIAAMITPAAEARRKATDSRRRTLVGINRYTVPPSSEVIAAITPETASAVPNGYERLRLRMIAHTSSGGTIPRAALWLHGDPSKSFRVAAFAEDFLRSGGFEVLPAVTLDPVTCNCRTLLRSELDIIVLCWSGESDLDTVPMICAVIQELRKESIIVMAAKPPENAEELLKAGLDRFIHLGSNAYADLLSLQHKTGLL